MDEQAICVELLAQVERIAREHAAAVKCVRVSLGALSGIEPALLERAYCIARAGTVAEGAELAIERAPPAGGNDLLLLTVDLEPVPGGDRLNA